MPVLPKTENSISHVPANTTSVSNVRSSVVGFFVPGLFDWFSIAVAVAYACAHNCSLLPYILFTLAPAPAPALHVPDR